MNSGPGDGAPENSGNSEAERLLRALYEQRIELGEIAGELISLLKAAGVDTPDGTEPRADEESS